MIQTYPPHVIILLSAPSGAGKTTTCQKLTALAKQTSTRVDGLLSPPVWSGKVKTGIRLQAISSGEARTLARKATNGETPDVGMWKFLPETITWGQEYLANISPCDLLILDEIGPLELLHQGGLTHSFDILQKGDYQMAVVTIRPHLLETMKEKLQGKPLAITPLTPENRDDLAEKLMTIFNTLKEREP